jgi:di/tricarboxylate transporter
MMDMLLTTLLGTLYLIGVLAAVLVALASNDAQRRADACKVLRMLISPLLRSIPQRRNNRTGALGRKQ